jgi:chemotaxis response regulator CheB
MDVMMPKMDGVETVRALTVQCPTPVVLTSVIARYPDHRAQLGDLDADWVALCEKPVLTGKDAAQHVSALLRRARALLSLRQQRPAPGKPKTLPASVSLVVIAASTGGMPALSSVLSQLPETFPPICIAQHLDADFFDSFVRFLQQSVHRPVVVVDECATLEPSQLYLAKKSHHLVVKNGLVCAISAEAGELSPRADLLLLSLSEYAGKDGLGIVLTGMGRDGALGLRRLREAGGWTISQDPKSALVSGMPDAALEMGGSCEVLPLSQIAARLSGLKWKPWSKR